MVNADASHLPVPFLNLSIGVYATFSCDLVMRRASPQDFGINMPRKRQARPGVACAYKALKSKSP